ncbi:MAG TPA: hypothetical protein VMZ53_32800 [Kofleriaceae bacterium]|nr:hypothetical protein [Kofleriaceae bacterium]
MKLPDGIAKRLTALAVAGCALVLAGCGRLAFEPLSTSDATTSNGDGDSGAPGLRPLHLYELNGTYADTYGGPSLVGAGGTFTANGYQFGINEGLSVDNALPASVYTIDIDFSFTDVAMWQKILDYKGLAADEGVYVYEGALQFVIAASADFVSGAPNLVADQRLRVTLTRDASAHVVGYLDRAPIAADRLTSAAPPASPSGTFDFDDTTHQAQLAGATAAFFIDDSGTTMGEASPGTVRRIAIWDVALTPAQVATLQ